MEPLKIAICDDEETALAIIESAVRSTLGGTAKCSIS